MTDVDEVEFPVLPAVPAPTNQLATIAKASGVELAVAMPIIERYKPHFDKAIALAESTKGLTVIDATDLTGMRKAREARLAFRAERCEAEGVRKQEKEVYNRMGKVIQECYNRIAGICEPEEARLLALEETAIRAEAARKLALGTERAQQLKAYGVLVDAFNIKSFSEMDAEAFSTMFTGYRVAHEQKQIAARKAEDERKATEAARVAEQKRLKEENERLRKEREENDAHAKAVADEQATALAVERKARDEAEKAANAALAMSETIARNAAQTKAREDAEAKKKLDAEEKARKKAAAAPDAEKLIAYADAIAKIPSPTVANESAKETLAWYLDKIAELDKWIRNQARGL